MSDKITTLNDPKGQAGRGSDQEPTPSNARLQWVADLVCAILNAENIKRSSSMVKRPPGM
ncbi:MAG: hypothetical protein E6G77_25565 [Alphaproteobacteria bacterium]|nr:MAG: hypothetical protein E6G77_25565 [Alphaproteobacteria bacterium]